jgi:CHAT domain-containing protein
MGEAYIKLKKIDHALAMFKSAMALYKKTREPIGQGDIYKTLGELYLTAGNKMGALDMFQEALRLLTAANSLVDMGHAYQGIGDVFFSAADLEKADQNYDLALGLYGQMQDMESQGVTLLKKASVSGRRDDVKETIRLYDAALAKFEQVRTRAAFSELKRSYMEKVYGHYEGAALYMLEKDQGEKALQYIEAMKARIFLDQLAEARVDLEKGIDSHVKKERDLLENTILMLRKRLAEENRAKFPDKKVVEELKNDLSTAQEKLDALTREIRYKNPLYASVEYPQPISAKALKENVLRDNEVLLEYFLAKKGVYCLVIGKNEFNVVKLPAKYEDITAGVQKMLGNVRGHQQGEPFGGDLAGELYRILVKPAEEYIAGKALIIAPQGILAYLPFEALMTEKDGEKIFMVEKYPMTYIQSGTVLGMLRSQHSTDNTRGGFVGFGDPVYDFQEYVKETEAGKKETAAIEDKGPPKDSSPGAVFMKNTYLRSGGTLTRLKGTAEEIETIHSMYEKTGARHQKYLRIDAREENAKSPEMGQYSYIHFSTHGILQPGFQAIALSQIPSDKEDGFLTLGEIMNTRFNARLVVLSACETGLGDLSNAEGVTGLTRAVMYAGSPAALVSLWSVADEATRDLMTTFYDGLIRKGLSKPDALRAAKISLIKDTKPITFKHPYFWSAFVMYGE